MSLLENALTKTHLDEAGDDPSQARAELAAAIDAINEIRSYLGIAGGICTLDENGEIPSELIGDSSSGSSPGDLKMIAHTAVPSGWLECDGSEISRTMYANLYAVIGTSYGAGDGSTTFNLPESRGEFIRGFDNGRGIDSDREFGSYQADQIKAHTHSYSDSGTKQKDAGYDDYGGGGNYLFINGSKTTGSTGGSETRPRNITVMLIIKY